MTSLRRTSLLGGWLSHPSEKYDFDSWEDDIPKIWKNKKWSKPPTRSSSAFPLFGDVCPHEKKQGYPVSTCSSALMEKSACACHCKKGHPSSGLCFPIQVSTYHLTIGVLQPC